MKKLLVNLRCWVVAKLNDLRRWAIHKLGGYIVDWSSTKYIDQALAAQRTVHNFWTQGTPRPGQDDADFIDEMILKIARQLWAEKAFECSWYEDPFGGPTLHRMNLRVVMPKKEENTWSAKDC